MTYIDIDDSHREGFSPSNSIQIIETMCSHRMRCDMQWWENETLCDTLFFLKKGIHAINLQFRNRARQFRKNSKNVWQNTMVMSDTYTIVWVAVLWCSCYRLRCFLSTSHECWLLMWFFFWMRLHLAPKYCRKKIDWTVNYNNGILNKGIIYRTILCENEQNRKRSQ